MNKEIDVSNVELRSQRLLLRPWRLSDLDDFFEYASVDGVGQMAGWQPHQSKDESRIILNKFIEHKKTFALEYQGKVIGSLGVEEYREDLFPELSALQCRELGYVLSKDYWGRGLMPEAVNAVIDYLFETVRLDALVCANYAYNTQSARVKEKCGFRHYKDEDFQGKHHVYGMLRRKEWELGKLFDKWTSILRLKNNWDVKLQLIDDPEFRKTGDFKVDPDDRKAILMLNVRNPKQENPEEVICHELLHLKLYPLDQLTEGLICGHYEEDTPAYRVIYQQFMTMLEQTVEELTKCYLGAFGENRELSYGRCAGMKSFDELYNGLNSL